MQTIDEQEASQKFDQVVEQVQSGGAVTITRQQMAEFVLMSGEEFAQTQSQRSGTEAIPMQRSGTESLETFLDEAEKAQQPVLIQQPGKPDVVLIAQSQRSGTE